MRRSAVPTAPDELMRDHWPKVSIQPDRSALVSPWFVSTAQGKTKMPHVIVKLTTGRSEQLKQEIAAAVTQAVASSARLSDDLVSVSIEEFEERDWADK